MCLINGLAGGVGGGKKCETAGTVHKQRVLDLNSQALKVVVAFPDKQNVSYGTLDFAVS